MPIDSATKFDKDRNFATFWDAEPVGASRWLAEVLRRAAASAPSLADLPAILAKQPGAADVAPFADAAQAAGLALTTPFAQFDQAKLVELGWQWNPDIRPQMIRGNLKIENTTSELVRRLVIRAGNREMPIVSNLDPLEAFAADLSAFVGTYDIALVGWSDGVGQFLAEEAAPVMNLPDLAWSDWAQGRLYEVGDADRTIALRVNSGRNVRIADIAMQNALRPFVGTGVVLYGRRTVADDGTVSLDSVAPELWFLTRLTNPADAANNLPAAPRPLIHGDRCLCIGATPPWNWQGPNIETHILCPLTAASMSGTEERRVVFGRPLAALPEGWPNPIAKVKRVIDASSVAGVAIDSPAHLATRRAPRGEPAKSIRGVAEIVSAEQVFVG